MDKTKVRKIGAITVAALGVLMSATYSIHLFLFKLSLPPWSAQTEGKYVAYGLEVWGFLWSIPVVVSLFLLAYLTHPSKIEKISTIAKSLSVILAIGGFGAAALLITSAVINNSPPAIMFIFTSIAGTSPFWMMGILAVFALKKTSLKT